MKQSIYNKRYITRVTLEAATPLIVGTGDKGVLTDALVALDINGLPYIPGTSIAGVLRHSIGDDSNNAESIFGFQDGNQGHGSRLIITDAVMLDCDGTPQDGLISSPKSDFLSHYDTLPVRQHVRINELGIADDGGKFDEQVVYQGTRFVFEMEMVDVDDDKENKNNDVFREVLKKIYSPFFRLGSGTRNGFGSVKVIDLKYRSLDLTKQADLELYLTKSSSLCQQWNGFAPVKTEVEEEDSWHEYVMELKPLDFFLFSSGFNDDDADMTPVTEARVIWDENGGRFSDESILIPATSVKGAIAHRVAYYWNKINGKIIEDNNGKTGGDNEAVKALFGHAGKTSEGTTRGNVLFSDIILQNTLRNHNKLLNHVTIDRITGGTIDGHLFTEKVINGRGMTFNLTLMVNNEVFQQEDGPQYKKALECALEDLCDGLLPLGGGTNRGHGIFTGKKIKGFKSDGKQ